MNTYLAVDPTELKLALALAETTIEGMEDLLPDVVLERVRRDLQGKLLWTAWGREQIAGYLGTWS